MSFRGLGLPSLVPFLPSLFRSVGLSRGGRWIWSAGWIWCALWLVIILCSWGVNLQRTKSRFSVLFSCVLCPSSFRPVSICKQTKKKGRLLSSFLPVVVFCFSSFNMQRLQAGFLSSLLLLSVSLWCPLLSLLRWGLQYSKDYCGLLRLLCWCNKSGLPVSYLCGV